MKNILAESLRSSVKSAILIIKLIVPLYILADLLLYFNLLQYISFLFAPITSLLDLPAETAMAIAGGVLLNLYAAIAFAAPLGLDPYQWTILAVFLGVCHSMVVESAIMKQLGISYFYSIFLRGSMAFVTVVPVMLLPRSIFSTAGEKHQVPLPEYASLFSMLQASLVQACILSLKIILLITVILIIMDLIKSTRLMQAYSKKVNTSFSIIVGQLLGITYGAGILIREAHNGHLSRRDVFFVATFLMICHSIIEDALLFVLFGANYFVIVGVRIIMALLISFLLLQLFSRFPVFRQHVSRRNTP